MNCKYINRIDLSNFDMSNVTDMSYMFSGCSKLTTIKFSKLINTEKVIDMNNMFSHCSSLQELDLSCFNTENVVYMNNMFYICENLKSLTLPFSKNYIYHVLTLKMLFI